MAMIKSCVILGIAATFPVLNLIFKQQLPMNIDGTYHPAFQPLADAFRQQLEVGQIRGGAFAVYHHGDLVFDMWGGYADEDTQRPWQQDTITISFSISKAIAAVVIASLVERGFIDYKRPVMDYWPEFGQNDKANITVEMLLSHQAGLPVLDETISIRDIRDNPIKVLRILESQKPTWPAGTKRAYHVVTYGLYVDALVKKVDPKGRTTAELFLEDIATPFDIGVYPNCPKEQFHRTAKINSESNRQILVDSLGSLRYILMFSQILFNHNSLPAKCARTVKEVSMDFNPMNNPDVREIPFSSISATGTARALAKFFGILANGGRLGDRKLLNKTTLALLSEPLYTDQDAISTLPDITFGRGMFFLKNPKGHFNYGHPGHGGQIAFADPTNNIGYSYLTNFLSIYAAADNPRFLSLQKVLYECLDTYKLSKT